MKSDFGCIAQETLTPEGRSAVPVDSRARKVCQSKSNCRIPEASL